MGLALDGCVCCCARDGSAYEAVALVYCRVGSALSLGWTQLIAVEQAQNSAQASGQRGSTVCLGLSSRWLCVCCCARDGSAYEAVTLVYCRVGSTLSLGWTQLSKLRSKLKGASKSHMRWLHRNILTSEQGAKCHCRWLAVTHFPLPLTLQLRAQLQSARVF